MSKTFLLCSSFTRPINYSYASTQDAMPIMHHALSTTPHIDSTHTHKVKSHIWAHDLNHLARWSNGLIRMKRRVQCIIFLRWQSLKNQRTCSLCKIYLRLGTIHAYMDPSSSFYSIPKWLQDLLPFIHLITQNENILTSLTQWTFSFSWCYL